MEQHQAVATCASSTASLAAITVRGTVLAHIFAVYACSEKLDCTGILANRAVEIEIRVAVGALVGGSYARQTVARTLEALR